MPDHNLNTGSLLDDDPTVATIGVGTRKASFRDRLRDVEKSAIDRFDAAWAKPLSRYAIMGVSSALAIGLGLGIYLAIRPVPKPDYEQAEMGRIFNYTLLTEEFNRLPVEERIDLIHQLVQRVGDMDASESVMMAQFFAGIANEAREQMERNAGKLMVDAADLVAKDYAAVPAEDRDAYLDDAYVRLVRLASPFDGSIEERTDEELLAQGRRDNQQGREAMGSGEVNADQAAGLLVFMDRQTAKSASPAQQQRLTLFMRDMTRRLREPGG